MGGINAILSKCQSLAKTKNFICADCVWSERLNSRGAYCSKVGSECNGHQSKPVHWCLEFELKEVTHEI